MREAPSRRQPEVSRPHLARGCRPGRPRLSEHVVSMRSSANDHAESIQEHALVPQLRMYAEPVEPDVDGEAWNGEAQAVLAAAVRSAG